MKNIQTARLVLNHLNERATNAQNVLAKLAEKRVWLDRGKTIQAAASGVFYGGYEISEGVSFDEFVLEMTEKLDAEFKREKYAGVDCYVFQPFAKGGRPDLSTELGMGYLSTLSDHADAIRDNVPPALGLDSPGGLSDCEDAWLRQALESRSVSLVNAFRNTETAMHYVLTARSGKLASCSPKNMVGEDEMIDAWLLQFALYLAIPGFPAATHFGSDGDGVNNFKTLPEKMIEMLSFPTGMFIFKDDTPCP